MGILVNNSYNYINKTFQRGCSNSILSWVWTICDKTSNWKFFFENRPERYHSLRQEIKDTTQFLQETNQALQVGKSAYALEEKQRNQERLQVRATSNACSTATSTNIVVSNIELPDAVQNEVSDLNKGALHPLKNPPISFLPNLPPEKEHNSCMLLLLIS